jgi:outer membrane cobalamin receptor
MGIVRNFTNSGKVSLNVFSVIQKNAIALSGKTYVDTELNLTRELYVNRDQEQSGVEFELVGNNLLNTFQPFLNFTVMKSLMDEDGNMVENRENPKFIMAGGAFVNKSSFDLNILAKYVSAFETNRFAPTTSGPQPLGNYMTIDFTAGYTTKGRVPVRFYIKSRNLADNHFSTVIGYPDFGRMIFAGIQLKM